MKTREKRLARLERKLPSAEPQFVHWGSYGWTPEEKAEAIRRNPNCRLFWRSLVDLPPMKVPPTEPDPDDPATPE